MKNRTISYGLIIWFILGACMDSKKESPVEESFKGPVVELGVSQDKEATMTFQQRSNELRVRSRSFKDFETFAAFAKKKLGAKIIYQDGKLMGIHGNFRHTGNLAFVDEKGIHFERKDFVSAYLGGSQGTMTIGENEIPLLEHGDAAAIDFNHPGFACAGNDCMAGYSWVTHTSFLDFGYHSAGSITQLASGGLETVSYTCCKNGGEMVTQNGRPQCRLRNPEAWEFDKELKVWLPDPFSDVPPYAYTDLQQCSYTALRNQLTVQGTFITPTGSIDCADCIAVETNVEEVKVGEYLFTVPGLDLGPFYIDDVIGVCSYHESSRGGSFSYSSGNTEGFCD